MIKIVLSVAIYSIKLSKSYMIYGFLMPLNFCLQSQLKYTDFFGQEIS